jgi:hypothetical protein
MYYHKDNSIQEKSSGKHHDSAKIKMMEPPISLTPGDRKACYNIALMQSVKKIETQGAMKNNGKALHEHPAHITQKPTEWNISR